MVGTFSNKAEFFISFWVRGKESRFCSLSFPEILLEETNVQTKWRACMRPTSPRSTIAVVGPTTAIHLLSENRKRWKTNILRREFMGIPNLAEFHQHFSTNITIQCNAMRPTSFTTTGSPSHRFHSTRPFSIARRSSQSVGWRTYFTRSRASSFPLNWNSCKSTCLPGSL